MNTVTVLKVVAGLVIGAAAWKAYKAATGAVSSTLDTLASLPGRALDAVAEAAQAVVDGTSPVSDPDGGGFVTEAPPARIVDYSKNRNIDPLIGYFVKWGNTADSRAQAYRAGWTADEISLAVLAMAQANGNQ